MQLSRRDFLEASAAGALALGLPPDAHARLPRAQLRELRAAVRGPVRAPGDRWLRRRAAGVQPPLRRDPAAGGRARARHGRRAGRRALGRTPRRAARRALGRQRVQRRVDEPRRRRARRRRPRPLRARRRRGDRRARAAQLRALPPARAPRARGPLGFLPERRDRRARDWRRHGAGGSRARADARPRHRAGRRDRGRRAAARERRRRPVLGAARRRRQLRRRHGRAPARAAVAAGRVVLRLLSCERARRGAGGLGRPRARGARRADVDLHADGHARERVRPVPRLGGRAAAAGRPAGADRRRALQRRHERVPRAPAPLGGLRGGRLRHGAARELRRLLRVRRAQAPGARPARLRRGRRRRRDAGARRLWRRDQPRAGRCDRVRAPRRPLQRADPLLQPDRHRAPAGAPGAGADRAVRQRRRLPELRRPRRCARRAGRTTGRTSTACGRSRRRSTRRTASAPRRGSADCITAPCTGRSRRRGTPWRPRPPRAGCADPRPL